MSDTKTRLLDAAETLFADHGIAETSLRDITTHAEANLAAVNYHFGGKDGLLAAVFDRRLRPVNQERLELLDAFESAAGADSVPLAQILYANLAPPFRMLDESGESGESGQRFMRIVARINADPSSSIHQAFLRHFDGIRARFLAALGRALPELEATEVERRFHYSLAAMFHTFCWGAQIACLCAQPHENRERVFTSLLEYAVAGLHAPRDSIDLGDLRRLESEIKGVPA
jgi:AcrR family transcriptional regulator